MVSEPPLGGSVSPHVECSNCDGNIDLSTVQEDMISHWEYCGASGKVEILETGQYLQET